MRVLFDHQAFLRARHGGVSRYFCEIIRELRRADGELEVDVALREVDNAHLKSLESEVPGSLGVRPVPRLTAWYRRATGSVPGVRRVFFEVRRRFGGAKEEEKSRRYARSVIRAGAYDIFHPTYYDPYFLEELGGRPFVLTVHDMIHELFGSEFPVYSQDPAQAGKHELVARASKIIAVSHTTKRDLVRLLNVSPGKISVIHHGPVLGGAAVGTRLDQPDMSALRYLLYVGGRRHYKNFLFFVESGQRALRNLEARLVCAGGGPSTDEEREHLHRIGAEDLVTFLPEVSDAMMAAYFRGAVAYASPSLYEGFGLPILDAFACGCPAVLSSTDVYHEVAGDAAIYFDPRSASSIGSVVARVLDDEDLRRNLIRRGAARLRRYSWEAAARATLDVYRSVV